MRIRPTILLIALIGCATGAVPLLSVTGCETPRPETLTAVPFVGDPAELLAAVRVVVPRRSPSADAVTVMSALGFRCDHRDAPEAAGSYSREALHEERVQSAAGDPTVLDGPRFECARTDDGAFLVRGERQWQVYLRTEADTAEALAVSAAWISL